MADPRYSKGKFVGFDPGARRRQRLVLQDSPLFYGWEPIERLPDGRRVWQLVDNRRVEMRRMSQADKEAYGQDDEWLVFVGGKPYATYNGEIEVVTADIRASVEELLRVPA